MSAPRKYPDGLRERATRMVLDLLEVICSYIDEHKDEFGVEPICGVLREAGIQIAPSTYYAPQQRSPSARAVLDEVLKEEIAQVHRANFRVFGARKMHIVLNREDDRLGRGHVARCTIERRMRDLGIHGIRRGKAPNATRSAPREDCPSDLVERHFSAFAPNQLWVADNTYVHTLSGWVIADCWHESFKGLCPHALRLGLRRIRHRRVQLRDRRLANFSFAAH